MAGAGLVSIGSIAVRIRKPSYNWTGSSDDGIASFRASGVMQWLQAQSVFELTNNPAARVTKGGESGVQEYLVFDDLLAPYTGYYLLQPFDLQADWQWSGHGVNYPVAFSLSAVFLGDVE